MALALSKPTALQLLITQKQLEHALDVSTMTIFKWRQGAVDLPPLPHKIIKRGERQGILFSPVDVLEWLKEWRPLLAQKFMKGEQCACKHCTRKRTAAYSTARGGTHRPLRQRPSVGDEDREGEAAGSFRLCL